MNPADWNVFYKKQCLQWLPHNDKTRFLEKLNRIPLAFQLASAYIYMTQPSLAHYINFRENDNVDAIAMFARKHTQIREHAQSLETTVLWAVARTWAISFGQPVLDVFSTFTDKTSSKPYIEEPANDGQSLDCASVDGEEEGDARAGVKKAP
jgi:hypothetical protein